MSDSPIESTKELHESKERKPEMTQRTENYIRNSDQLLVKAAPSMGWRGWMKVYLPDGDAYRVRGEEFDRDFTRVGLSRGAEPETLARLRNCDIHMAGRALSYKDGYLLLDGFKIVPIEKNATDSVKPPWYGIRKCRDSHWHVCAGPDDDLITKPPQLTYEQALDICGKLNDGMTLEEIENPSPPRGEAETPTEEDKFFAWIMRRMLAESLPVERARWRVLLAAFLDATRTEPRPEQERRPDRPQWDIVTLRSALENWGWHHDWCDFGNPTPCNCGYLTALEIGKYATENPNAD